MKNKLLEASGEESNMDVTSESGSNTDVVTDTDDDNAEGIPSAKRRKLKPSERDLQMPLERGWKRETVIKGLGKTGVIKGDVSYYSPCGKTFRSSPDLVKVSYNILQTVILWHEVAKSLRYFKQFFIAFRTIIVISAIHNIVIKSNKTNKIVLIIIDIRLRLIV